MRRIPRLPAPPRVERKVKPVVRAASTMTKIGDLPPVDGYLKREVERLPTGSVSADAELLILLNGDLQRGELRDLVKIVKRESHEAAADAVRMHSEGGGSGRHSLVRSINRARPLGSLAGTELIGVIRNGEFRQVAVSLLSGGGGNATSLGGQPPSYYTNIVARLGYTPLDAESYTAADVLAKIKTVDGSGSGLDADLLDGQSGAYFLDWANLTGVPATFAPSAHNQAWSTITGRPTDLSGYGITDAQPLDSDLTAIAALTTTSFGRGLLELANAQVARNTIGLGNSSAGWLGILQGTPLAPVHVGAGTAVNSINPGVLLSRTETRAAVNAHGYSDSTNFVGSTAAAYNSFDARITLAGTGAVDHFAGFQSAPTFNGSGITTNTYDFYSAPTVNTGAVVSNRYGLFVTNSGGSGTIGQETGVYIAELTRGGSAPNYALYCQAVAGSGHASNSNIHDIVIGQAGGDYPSFGYNAIYTTTTGAHKYAATGEFSTRIKIGNLGRIETFTAPSGTAGAAITYTAGPYVANLGTSWTTPSDARLKRNFELSSVWDRVDGFEYGLFEWIETGHKDAGTIAQSALKCFPELVDQSSDILGFNYDRAGAAALYGLRECKIVIASLLQRIEELEARR